MRAPALLSTIVALAACGGGGAPRRAGHDRRLANLAATPAGAGDQVVATVDGRPVYASCVTAQAATHTGAPDPRRAALDDCLALELAGQEAERRGLTEDPEIVEESTRVLAAALVDREFTARYHRVTDLPPAMVEDIFQRNARRMSRPEYRASFFARVEYTGEAGTPADLAAQRTAQRAYDTFLAGRSDLFSADVDAALRVVALPGQKISSAVPEPAVKDGILLPYYRDPLFALTSVGQVTAPARGPYGWDLILYTDRIDALESTRDQILDDLFPRMRMHWFQVWTSQLEKSLGAERFYDDASIGRLLGGEGDS